MILKIAKFKKNKTIDRDRQKTNNHIELKESYLPYSIQEQLHNNNKIKKNFSNLNLVNEILRKKENDLMKRK
jgi:hypothetical protein